MKSIYLNCINHKNGSYLLSGAVIFPILILGTVFLISLIPMIASLENVIFEAAEASRYAMLRSAFGNLSGAEVSAFTLARLKMDEKNLSLDVPYAKVNIEGGDMEDLISIQISGNAAGYDPFSRFRSGRFTFQIVSRAFTGKETIGGDTEQGFDQEEKSVSVYLFPMRGKRYHNADCPFLKAYCLRTPLTEAVKNKYSPCRKCHAKKAGLGSEVFIFSKTGKVYHRSSCKSVKKYYIEMDRLEAERKGYTMCRSCGG